MDNHCSTNKATVQNVQQKGLCRYRVVGTLILVGVGLHVPPPKWLTFWLTAQEALVFLLRLIHFLKIRFRKILRFDKLVDMVVTNDGVIRCIFRWLAEHITVRHTGVVDRFKHSANDTTKFLMGNMRFLCNFPNFGLVQNRPEALACWEIASDVVISHVVSLEQHVNKFCKKIVTNFSVKQKCYIDKNVKYNCNNNIKIVHTTKQVWHSTIRTLLNIAKMY